MLSRGGLQIAQGVAFVAAEVTGRLETRSGRRDRRMQKFSVDAVEEAYNLHTTVISMPQ